MGEVRDLAEPQREYARRLARQRLHQPAFRTRVLLAYETRCAICELKHGSLLDAAHIVPDSEEHGVPPTSNGLAPGKIHHAAYDQNTLGVSPDYRVAVNRSRAWFRVTATRPRRRRGPFDHESHEPADRKSA